MTTTYHTEITTGAAANASVFNAPLAELDDAIGTVATSVGGSAAAVTLEVVNARDGWPTLLDHLDAIVLTGNGTNTGLPLTAGPLSPLSGTLYMNPGADDSAQLFRVPTTSANNGDILFNVGASDFAGVTDVILNLGFNNPVGGGKVDGALHSWYLQMENDYYTGGEHWAEAFFSLYPATGDGLRPMMFRYNVDGTEGFLTFIATTFSFAPMTGPNHAIYITTAGEAVTLVKLTGIIELWPTAASGSGLIIQGLNGVNPMFNLDTTTDSVSWFIAGVRYATKGNVDVFSIDMASKQTVNTGALILYPSAVGQIPFQAVALAGQTANMMQTTDEVGNPLWAILPNGAMRPATIADASAANNTVYYSSTASKLVFKDSGGTVNALY